MKSRSLRLALVLLILPAFKVSAATLYVDLNCTNPVPPYADWSTAATNIQDAINHAGFGDTVLVTNGVYQYGNTGNSRIALFTALTVQSVNGPAFTAIQGYQVPGTTNGSSAVRCVGLVSGATLSGFTLTNGATPNYDYGGGVKCAGTNCLVTNCVIINNAAYDGGGGAYQGTLINCSLIGNTASALNVGSGGGASQSTLINCLLARNFAGYIGGAALGCVLINCTVVNNSAAAYAGSLSGGYVNNSIVYYNFSYYTNADNSGGNTFTNCCVSFSVSGGANNFTNPPLFANPAAGDYHLNAASPCINAGNNSFVTSGTDLDGNPRIVGGIVDLGAYEFQSPVRYVNINNTAPVSPFTNWITAATNIQDAIDAANPGDFIVVSNGIYQTGGRTVNGYLLTNRVVIDKAVTVQSVNGPASTAIAGFRNANLPPTGIRCVCLTNGAALMGFTLTNGATLTTGDISQGQSGGGAWCTDSGVVLSNCVFAGNAAARYGGGAFQGTVFNCTFTNNSASYGGGAASNALFNCTLARNSSLYQNFNYGGGAYACTLNNSLIVGNQSVAGGGFGGGAAFSTLTACVVSNNSAGASGGGLFESIANRSLISSNRSVSAGGGAFSSTLNNCSVSTNSARYGGGACFGSVVNSVILNNIAGTGGGTCSNTLINCVLNNNAANYDGFGDGAQGGGAYNSALINCTVVSNSAVSLPGGAAGGGIVGCTLTDCIVYYNSSSEAGPNFWNSTMNYCDTTPLPTNGVDNITNDPAFVGGGDFHLQSNSPCINSGNNAYIATSTDLDGNPRIVGGTVDIGAYEYQTPTSVISYAWLQQYGLPTDGSVDYADLDGTGLTV